MASRPSPLIDIIGEVVGMLGERGGRPADMPAPPSAPPPERARGAGFGMIGDAPGEDIEAVAFRVLMAAARSAQEDLKAVMADVREINRVKAAPRALPGDLAGALGRHYAGRVRTAADHLVEITGLLATLAREQAAPSGDPPVA